MHNVNTYCFLLSYSPSHIFSPIPLGFSTLRLVFFFSFRFTPSLGLLLFLFVLPFCHCLPIRSTLPRLPPLSPISISLYPLSLSLYPLSLLLTPISFHIRPSIPIPPPPPPLCYLSTFYPPTSNCFPSLSILSPSIVCRLANIFTHLDPIVSPFYSIF